jgi:hypothetical protein
VKKAYEKLRKFSQKLLPKFSQLFGSFFRKKRKKFFRQIETKTPFSFSRKAKICSLFANFAQRFVSRKFSLSQKFSGKLSFSRKISRKFLLNKILKNLQKVSKFFAYFRFSRKWKKGFSFQPYTGPQFRAFLG